MGSEATVPANFCGFAGELAVGGLFDVTAEADFVFGALVRYGREDRRIATGRNGQERGVDWCDLAVPRDFDPLP